MTDRRPHTTTAEFHCVGGIDTLYVCDFCRAPVSDQTLESWEPCCAEFELACENRELRDLLHHLYLGEAR